MRRCSKSRAIEPPQTQQLSEMTPSEPLEVQPSELITDAPPVLQSRRPGGGAGLRRNWIRWAKMWRPRAICSNRSAATADPASKGADRPRARPLVREGGGTEGSEKAVAAGSEVDQEPSESGWQLELPAPSGACPCPDLGTLDAAFNGATAMALLPFLGAGHTHKEGQYQREVQAGLYYLLSRQKANGTFWESGGNLYSHGLCAIALSEAFAMTQDQALMRPAQAALDYIAFAQDPVGGGWRYVAQTARRYLRCGLATDGNEERAHGLSARGSVGL